MAWDQKSYPKLGSVYFSLTTGHSVIKPNFSNSQSESVMLLLEQFLNRNLDGQYDLIRNLLGTDLINVMLESQKTMKCFPFFDQLQIMLASLTFSKPQIWKSRIQFSIKVLICFGSLDYLFPDYLRITHWEQSKTKPKKTQTEVARI